MQVRTLEHDVGNDAEYRQRYALLNDLQLDQVEGTSILYETETISGYLAAVFEEGYHPRKGDDSDEGPVV